MDSTSLKRHQCARLELSINQLTVRGVQDGDLAKNVFQVHGIDRNEKVIWQRKLKREEWLKVLLEKTELGCEIGMEACGGAHHWARLLQERGYIVKLMAPQFVKPLCKE